MTFYNRTNELQTLADAESSAGHSLFVVYGRRRVGKTELLKEFCREKSHIYFLAAQEAEQRQREKFIEQVADHFNDRVPRLDGWDETFEYLGEKLQANSTVVIIDEFPYLVAENDSIPSYLQSLVDEQLQNSESMLVLCGSSVSTMESEVLGSKSPLYGRRTGQLDLQPFSFSDAREVIEYDFVDTIRSYAVTSGTPLYLTLFDYSASLAENIRTEILSPSAVLYNEPSFLLRTELRNPARYMSILESIALGATTPNEIAGKAGVDVGPLSKYLQTLRQLRLIDREVPVTATAQKSKRSRYRISDAFLRFWFRFVEPNRSGIEEAPTVVFEETIAPALSDHIAPVFETISQEALWAAIRADQIDPYSEVGRWWYDGAEIDVVGLAPDADRILFGECKWTSDPVGEAVATQLEDTAEQVRWGSPTREEEFVLFSKAGFTDGVVESRDEQWSLFDLDRLKSLF
jgi:AAA+ ATPase superfamily predicted ATPase